MRTIFRDATLAELDQLTNSRDVGQFIKDRTNADARVERPGILLAHPLLASDGLLDARGSRVMNSDGNPLALTAHQTLRRRIRIAGIGDPYEDATFAGDTHVYQTVERLTCALAVLNFYGELRPETIAGAQQVVNSILLDHPNLLNPRFLVPHRHVDSATVEWRSVMTMLATSYYGMLPCVEAGASEEQVERFASSAALSAAISITVPRKGLPLGSKTVEMVVHGGSTSLQIAEKVGLQMRPRFLTSLLSLGVLKPLAERESWPTSKTGLGQHWWMRTALLDGIWRAAGMRLSTVLPSDAFPQFLQALLRSGLLAHPDVASGLTERAARWTLATVTDLVPVSTLATSAAQTLGNTRLAIGAIRALGMAENDLAAARWLHDELVSEGRPNHRALPPTNMEGAAGFLQAVVEAGYVLPPMPLEERRGAASSLDGVREAWLAAHRIVWTEQAMKAAIQSEAGPQTEHARAVSNECCGPVRQTAPARRRQVL